MIAFIQRIYSRLTGVPSSVVRMEFDDSDTGDYGPVDLVTRDLRGHPDVILGPPIDPPRRKPRGRVDPDAATSREAQEEDY